MLEFIPGVFLHCWVYEPSELSLESLTRGRWLQISIIFDNKKVENVFILLSAETDALCNFPVNTGRLLSLSKNFQIKILKLDTFLFHSKALRA